MDALSLGRIERRFAPLIAAGIAAMGSLIAIAWGVRVADVLPGMAVADDEPPPPGENDAVLLEPLGMGTAVPPDTEAVQAPISEVPETTTGGIVAATTGAEVGTTAAPEPVVEEPEPVESLPLPLPNGRWVLFDRDGFPIDAIVHPWCRWWAGDCEEFGPATASCVWVEYLGQDRIRAPYRLQDGVPDGCYDPSGIDRNRFAPLPNEYVRALPDGPYTLQLVYYD